MVQNHLNVPVIASNQSAPSPKLPFVSYTVITLMKTNNGTYGEYLETQNNETIKIYRKEFQQIWSFTAQSDNDAESKTIALKLYDYFDRIGITDFSDNGIVIQRIGDITNRDNLLTIEYEYRNGFDVTFAFMNEIVGVTEDEINDIKLTNSQGGY